MYIQGGGYFQYGLAFLIACIVKHEMDRPVSIFRAEFSEHLTDFCGGNVAVIHYRVYFLCNKVHCSKDVIPFGSLRN